MFINKYRYKYHITCILPAERVPVPVSRTDNKYRPQLVIHVQVAEKNIAAKMQRQNTWQFMCKLSDNLRCKTLAIKSLQMFKTSLSGCDQLLPSSETDVASCDTSEKSISFLLISFPQLWAKVLMFVFTGNRTCLLCG